MSNASITGEDSRPTVTSIYAYVVQNLDGEEIFFLSNYPGGVEIEGLPSAWGADDPQIFSPAQVTHGRIERRDGIDKVSFDFQAQLKQVAGLSRYTLFGAIPNIQIDVIRVSPGPVLAGIPAVYGRDTTTVQSGIIELFGTQGYLLNSRCTPEAFITGHQVPRWRHTRTCNRQLYAVDCGVNRELHKLEGNVVSTNYQARTMVISGQLPADKEEDYFRMGVLLHQATGTRHSIFQSSYAGEDTRVWLHQWFPDFQPGDVVTLYAGCNHTIDHCSQKFANLANFGGFPLVPNKNPAMHGV